MRNPMTFPILYIIIITMVSCSTLKLTFYLDMTTITVEKNIFILIITMIFIHKILKIETSSVIQWQRVKNMALYVGTKYRPFLGKFFEQCSVLRDFDHAAPSPVVPPYYHRRVRTYDSTDTRTRYRTSTLYAHAILRHHPNAAWKK